MGKYKSLLPIMILSLFTNICIIFVFNYTVGTKIASQGQPYNLSSSYALLTSDYNQYSNFSELVDFRDYENLIVISIIENTGTVGLLDLPMAYYRQTSKVIAPNVYRYFSQKDYLNRNNVGIVVGICDMFEIDAVKSSKTLYGLDEVLNCFQTDVWGYESVRLIRNIYAIDFQGVSSVYVDSVDLKEIDHVVKTLTDAGFRVLEKENNISVSVAFFESLFGRKIQQFTAFLGISVYAMYLFVVNIFVRKYNNTLRVHRMVGARYRNILGSVVIQTIITSLCITGVVSFVIVYFRFMGINSLTWWHFYKVQIFMLVTNILIFVGSVYINLAKNKNLLEEYHYD